jgi:uncharacterized membrane protein YqjE
METYTHPQPSTTVDDRSLGDLFGDLSQKASLLIRQEIRLANVEMKQKASKASKELALIIVGAVLANAALLALVAAVIIGLAEVVEPWLAALIVAVLLAIIAGIMAYAGIQNLRQMSPAPERTMATIEEDKEWLKQQLA